MQETNHCRAIVFDFDYTLADSSEPVWDCINTALTGLGLPSVSREAACRTIGLSLPEAFVKLGGREHADKTWEFVGRFVRRADEIMVDQTIIYDSAREMLEQLRPRGLNLGIVSTKYRRRIEAILEREGLRQDFTAAACPADRLATVARDPGR
jgi:phosphoglycolate phosphatase